jgi:DNA-binding response OmpR family regulator
MDAEQNNQYLRPLVAIVDTTQESIELLRGVLAEAGFATVVAYTLEFKRGERDLRAFFADYRPQAVVYDIAIPYVQNWQFFHEHVLANGVLPAERFIITTANRTVLDLLVGPTPAIELIGRPYDLAAVVAAVRRVIPGSAPYTV